LLFDRGDAVVEAKSESPLPPFSKGGNSNGKGKGTASASTRKTTTANASSTTAAKPP